MVDIPHLAETKENKRNLKSGRKMESETSSQLPKKRKCKKEHTPPVKIARKRTKLLSSGESSSKNILDLATRRDVVNKTILRVLRRHLSLKFKSCQSEGQEPKQDKKGNFFMNVKTLATEMFGENHPEFKLLHFYLASIIDYKYITEEDIGSSGLTSRELTIFYDCLYKYSHTRLDNLFSVKPLGEIYNQFYTSERTNILRTESSLSKNKSLYEKVMKEFSQIFFGKIDINTLII